MSSNHKHDDANEYSINSVNRNKWAWLDYLKFRHEKNLWIHGSSYSRNLCSGERSENLGAIQRKENSEVLTISKKKSG